MIFLLEPQVCGRLQNMEQSLALHDCCGKPPSQNVLKLLALPKQALCATTPIFKYEREPTIVFLTRVDSYI